MFTRRSRRSGGFTRLGKSGVTGQNEEVITLTEPQVWTLIGVFAAAIFGVQGIAISSFRRELKSLRNEMVTRFEAMDRRLDALDRDVQYLMKRQLD